MSQKITFLLGGVRSGKSSHAVRLGSESGLLVTFLATCIPQDDEMRDRVSRHQADRAVNWNTVVVEGLLVDSLAQLSRESCAILDCLTLYISRGIWNGKSEETLLEEVCAGLTLARERDLRLIVVSNEVGMGVVPAQLSGRAFRDCMGRIHELVARESDETFFVIAGKMLRLE